MKKTASYLRSSMPSIAAVSLGLFMFKLTTSPAFASERVFAYTYQSLTAPVGELELENKITWKSRPGEIRNFSFQHELEYGLTEKTQLALYMASWEFDARARESAYKSSGIEVIHNFTHPLKDPVGSALYGELQLGDRHLSLEGKLILEKKIGPWSLAWNGAVEAEWEGNTFGDFREPSGELSQVLGLSYEVTKKVAVGAEILHEIPLENWHGPAKPSIYMGPNLTFRKGRFYTTATALFQTTREESSPNIQIRTVFGIEF